MQKFAILSLAIIAVLAATVLLGQNRKSGISGGGSTIAPTVIALPSITITSAVPLPTGEDIIRTFITLINEKNIPDAIAMMDTSMVSSDSDKQQYGVVFNSFASITVSALKMEDFGKEDWKEGEERYRVDLMISLKPNGQSGIWDNGINTRWITVLKQGGRFMIHDIATGP